MIPPGRPLVAAAIAAVAVLLAAGRPVGSDSDAGAAGAGDVPAKAAKLFPFLQAGKYRSFPHESDVHSSEGPHGDVRTYLNPKLFRSLKKNRRSHPKGAAAIKELYDGDELIGWAVLVKTAANSRNGKSWYCYEIFSTTDPSDPAANGKGEAQCVGCHRSGRDYIRTEFPLE